MSSFDAIGQYFKVILLPSDGNRFEDLTRGQDETGIVLHMLASGDDKVGNGLIFIVAVDAKVQFDLV